MKQIVSILTILIFLVPTLLRVGIMVDFSMHQDFIARMLCVNNDVPGSTCKGKCHLKKQLKQTEEPKHSKMATVLKENTPSSFHLPVDVFRCEQQVTAQKKISFRIFKSFKKSPYLDNLFRPPQYV